MKLNSNNPFEQAAGAPLVRRAGWIAVAALGLTLAACGERQEPTVGQQIDRALEKTEQAAQQGAEQARHVADSAMKDARQAGEKAAAVVDDAAITASVAAGLAKDPDLSALRVDVQTQGGVVTLKGPAPTLAARERATQIVLAVKGVSGVNNMLEVKAG
jgi:osmotically-inducible protein OsmY